MKKLCLLMVLFCATWSYGAPAKYVGKFFGDGRSITNVTPPPASGQTNVALIFHDGTFGSIGINSLLAGSSFPLTGDVDFGGHGASGVGFLTVTGQVTVATLQITQFEVATNPFTGTVVNFGTNDYFIRTSSDVGIIDVAGVPSGSIGYSVIHIAATADINVTNSAKLRCGDFLTSRVLTNGTLGDFVFQAGVGCMTNSFFIRSP